MDLMDFEPDQPLYFEEALSSDVTALIDQSSEAGKAPEGEAPLLKARELAPDSYSVVVSLYRYYYFTHRYEDCFAVGETAFAMAARDLNWPADWQALSPALLEDSGRGAVPTVRFLLFALKGMGYLKLRLGQPEAGLERLRKVAEMDPEDRLGAKALAEFCEELDLDDLSPPAN